MIHALFSGKNEQDHYVKHFAVGAGAKISRTRNFISPGQSSTVRKHALPSSCTGIAFSGILRGNAHLFDLSIERGIDFYYIDHSYFNSGYARPMWMRVIKNGFAQNVILSNIDEDKFNSLGITIKNYNFKEKKNIVVLPPSNSVSRVFNQQDWEAKTIENIRKYTDRPIVIRKKNGPIMDDFLITTASEERYEYDESLDSVLDNAYCVVTFNSSTALRALERGIPVICDRYCPAFPLTHDFSEIENLQEKDRLPLFKSLASGQFTVKDIGNPKTFAYINSTIQWKGPIK